MSKFKVGDRVAFQDHVNNAPYEMIVSDGEAGINYCECFYFTDDRHLQVGTFPNSLLNKIEDEGGASTTPYIGVL